MIRCLVRARREARGSEVFVFPSDNSPRGHVRKLGRLPFQGHALRRSYASAAGDAGVLAEVVGRLLNHRGDSLAAQVYMQSSAMLRSLHVEQEKISRHSVALLQQ